MTQGEQQQRAPGPADPILRTRRLVLRPYAPGDEGAVTEFVAANRDTLASFLAPWALELDTPNGARQFLRWERSGFVTRKRMTFSIWRDGTLMGEVTFFAFDPGERSCEVGYYLDRWQIGSGIATEAVGAACAHVLHTTDVRTIAAVCAQANTAGQAVAERAGFVRAAAREGAVIFYLRR